MTHSLYFMFVDGIGIGLDTDSNPFTLANMSGWSQLVGNTGWTQSTFTTSSDPVLVRKAIDANLGVEGLPQSGTGQATLFAGVNCAALAGRHYGPIPHSTSRPVLREKNLFTRIGAARSVFANAYPERFFEVVSARDRWPTTTRCCLDAGVRIRTMDDLRAGNALAADLTGQGLSAVASSAFQPISEAESASRIATLCDSYSLVVSEYFHSDKAGHAMDTQRSIDCLETIGRFLLALDQELDWSRTTFVLTSDHGNMEDLSVKTHTRNAVPLLVRGPGAKHFDSITDLTGLADAIERSLAS